MSMEYDTNAHPLMQQQQQQQQQQYHIPRCSCCQVPITHANAAMPSEYYAHAAAVAQQQAGYGHGGGYDMGYEDEDEDNYDEDYENYYDDEYEQYDRWGGKGSMWTNQKPKPPQYPMQMTTTYIPPGVIRKNTRKRTDIAW